MNKQLFRFLFCASLLWIVCFPILTAEAKGSPARVIITGAGMETPLEITDPAILQDFGIYGFEVVSQRLEASANPGEGYQITRFILDKGKYLEWDRLVYYPQPSGQTGLVFYEGMRQPAMSSEFDGYWYAVSPEGEKAMRRVLFEVQKKCPQTSGTEHGSRMLILSGLAAGAPVAFSAVVVIRRRALARV